MKTGYMCVTSEHKVGLIHVGFGLNSLSAVTAACTWNNLPQHVTSARSMLFFWSRLKTYLFHARQHMR